MDRQLGYIDGKEESQLDATITVY